MRSISERWLNFRVQCIASDATPLQLQQLRIAFYAGFRSMLDANLELGMIDDEVVAVALLELFHTEINQFDPTA